MSIVLQEGTGHTQTWPNQQEYKTGNCLNFPKISWKAVTGIKTEASPYVFGSYCGGEDACSGMSTSADHPGGTAAQGNDGFMVFK